MPRKQVHALRPGRRYRPAVCAYLILTVSLISSLSSFAADTKTSGSSGDLSGRLRTVYDYRKLGDETDSDAYGYWYIRGRNYFDKHVDFYSSGRYHGDLDGAGSSYADDVFTSAEDSDGDSETRVLQLYVDVHDRDKDFVLRGGRQYVEAADYIHMDGAQLMMFERRRLGGRVFLGQPVSYYSPISGDVFGGFSLVGRPWDGNQSRLTFASYKDDSRDDTDAHVFIDVRQQVTDLLRTRGQVSVMNGDFRMGGFDLFVFGEDRVSDLALGVRRWGEYDAETRVFSPLYSVLGDQEPYTYAYARLTQEILPWFLVAPGAAMRFMDSNDEDAQNREYGHYDLALIFEPSRAFDASVAVEYWDVQDDDRFFGLSGEVRYRHRKLWEVSAGAAYLDYEYTQLTDFSYTTASGDTLLSADGTRSERSPDAYTYFLRGKWKINPHLALRLRGEIEDDSLENDLSYRARGSLEIRF